MKTKERCDHQRLVFFFLLLFFGFGFRSGGFRMSRVMFFERGWCHFLPTYFLHSFPLVSSLHCRVLSQVI